MRNSPPQRITGKSILGSLAGPPREVSCMTHPSTRHSIPPPHQKTHQTGTSFSPLILSRLFWKPMETSRSGCRAFINSHSYHGICSTLPSPTVSERNRAVPSVSECFRVFPTIFQLSSERFRAVLSNSERFRAFPIYFIKNFKVHFL